MSLAFAQHLEDFGQPSGMEPIQMFGTPAAMNIDIEKDIQVDVAAIRAAAYQEGFDAALAEMQAKHDNAQNAMQQSHNQDLAQLETELGQSMAQNITDGFRGQVDDNCAKISQEVGKILSHFVSQELTELSVHQLQELIKSAFAENESAQIKIEGPQVLVEKVQQSLGDEFAKIEVHQNDDINLSVEIDQTLMVTKLDAWRATFGDKL